VKIKIIMLGVLLAVPLISISDFKNDFKAIDLYKFCTGIDQEKVNYCEAYLHGVLDTVDGICLPPEKLNSNKIRLIYQNYAGPITNLDAEYLTASLVAYSAFKKAFPCTSTQKEERRKTMKRLDEILGKRN